ncbi:hypothetical protein PHMEG_00029717 [Phytophthora megakarya]|uniref:HAT C-terminal dimerisation domain-containing protein n=1 Tax=Phytophthora megakarya TaxID=4795 RepID=A0A225V4G1_9STRA|nr:hypothetical protein PHMEG_00029717 [Phytophthora megakarya]
MKQHPDVECRHCDKIIRHAQPKKNLYPHLERCTKVPSDVRAKYASSTSKRRRESSDKVATPSKRARITARNETTESISLTEKKEFHLEVARAFFHPNREMRCILTKYCPGMSLPTRQELATTLLDRVYADELANVMEVLKEPQHVAIVCDGWSDPNSESVVNFMVTSPFIRPIFWSSERCGDRQHTGEYMASALRKVIQEVEEVTGKGSVCGVVTDNASNMRKAWELFMEKMSHLTCHGCAAHTINLLLQDIFKIPSFAGVLKKAVAVTKFVRKRAALLYHFRAKQRSYFGARQRRRALMLPVATRSYSSTNCIESVVKNEEVLREVFSNSSLLERYEDAAVKLNQVEGILGDSVFWTDARTVMRLVNPIIKVLGALERDGCCLSMIYYYIGGLQNHVVYHRDKNDVSASVLTRIRDRIKFRWKSLKCESVLAAFLLDPSKAVDAFEDNDLDDAINKSVEFATRVGLPSSVSPATCRRELLGFIRLKKSWSPDEQENNLCDAPLDWWMLKSKRFPLLYDFATRVLSLPTSSAASERSWSVHSFLHNKRRNRLKPERVEKLAFIYSNTGDKGAKSQVHYMEKEEDVNERHIFDLFRDSDIESPVLPESPNAASASARNEAADLERSASGITPRARRTLFSPWDENHHETFSTTSSRSAPFPLGIQGTHTLEHLNPNYAKYQPASFFWK